MAVDPQRFLAAALGGDASPSSPPPPVSSGGGYAVDPQSFLQAALAPDPEAEARARQPFLPPPIPGVAEGIEAELQFGNGTRTQPTVLEQLGGVGRAVVTGGQQLLGGLGTALETAGQGMQQPGITGGALAGVPLEAIGQVLSQGAEQYQANAYPAELERQAMAEQSPLWGYAQDVAAQVPQIAAAMATGGGAPALALLGASAAGQGIQQAEAEGATPGEAVAYGTASGVIEAATERIGTIPLVDKILKRAITGPVVKGGALKRVLADISRNFGEEFAASVGNEIAAVATYQEGISPDALQKAVYSGLVGAGLGGGVSAMAEVANRGAAPEPPPPVLPTEAPVEAPQAAPPVVEAPVAQDAPPLTPEPIPVPQVEPLPPQPEVVPQAPPAAVVQPEAPPVTSTVRAPGERAATEVPATWTRPGHLYRAMTQEEFSATVGSGSGIQSRGDFSAQGEGTSLADNAPDAESYVNFGRDDPRVTGKPTYLVEVSGTEGAERTKDGYWKASGKIPQERITRIWRMSASGDAVVAEPVAPPAPPQKPTRKRKAGPSPEELAQLQAEAAPVEQAPAAQEVPKPREKSILVADFGGRRLSDVYKNPTQSDINAIRKLNRFEHSDRNSMSEPQFRSLLDADGNVYVWSSFEGSHEQAKKELESRGVKFVGDGLARVGSTYNEVYPDSEYQALFTRKPSPPPTPPAGVARDEYRPSTALIEREYDTRNPPYQSDDDNLYVLRNAALPKGDTLEGIHVTDDPTPVVEALRSKRPISQGRGGYDAGDLGGGLYFSQAPEIWESRSRGKWSFLGELTDKQRSTLADALSKRIAASKASRYITAIEAEAADETIAHWRAGTISLQSITQLAAQPYNERFWQPEFLEPLGIDPGKMPQRVPVKVKGKFAKLSRDPVPSEVEELRKAGYDGAYTTGGFSTTPQFVVWNNDAVVQFGDYSKQEAQNAEAAQADVAEAGRPAPTQTPVAAEAGRPAPAAVLEETPDALRRQEGRQEGREAVAETPAQPVAEPTPSPAPAEPIAIESTPESGRAGTPRIEAYTERPSIDPMTGEEGTYRTEYRIRKPTVEDREKSKYPLGNYLLERRSIRRGEDLGWELLDEGKSREYLFDYISADATPVSEGFRKSAEARLAQRVKDAEEKERKEAEEAAAEVRRAAKKRGDDAFVRMQNDPKYEGILKEWVSVHDAAKASGDDFLASLKADAGFMELYNRALDEHRLPQKSKAYREVIANLKTRLEIARGEKNLKKAIPSRKGSGIVAGAAPTRMPPMVERVQPFPGETGRKVEELGEPSALKTWLRRWFTSKRGLPPKARDIIEERAGRMDETALIASDMARSLDLAIGRHVESLAEAEESRGVEADRDALTAKVKAETLAVMKGETAPEASGLPQPILVRVKAFRDSIDPISTAIAEEEGMVSDALKEVFGENVGKYLTRPYSVHQIGGENRIKQLRENGGVEWSQIRDEIAAMPEFEGWDNDRIEGWMEAELGRFEAGSSPGARGKEPGTQLMGIYKRRKDIPEPIRRLYGEIKDPSLLGFLTLTNVRRNLDTFRMYSALREAGLKDGWLSETERPGFRDVGMDEATAPLFSRRHREKPGEAGEEMEDAEDMPENKGVVRGTLFGRKDVLDTIRMGDQYHRNVFSWVTGAIKKAKTVYSLTAQIRNAAANPLLIIGSGNLGPAPWRRASTRESVREALADVRRGSVTDRWGDALEGLGEDMSLEAIGSRFGRAARLGLLTASPDIKDLKRMLESPVVQPVELGSPKEFWRRLLWAPPGELSGVRRALRAVDQRAMWLYGKGDAVPKYIAWRNETQKMRYAYPNMSEEQAEVLAADAVKDMFPTDTRAPQFLRAMRQFPVAGTFISFISEIPRNVKNIAVRGAKEVSEGRRTGNDRLMKVGVHRLSSLVAASTAVNALAYGVAAAVQKSMGWGREEYEKYESAARVYLPFYAKNQTLAVMPLGKGKAVAFDLSFMDPYAVIKDPILTFLRTGILDEKEMDRRLKAAADEALDPYWSPGLGMDLVTTLMRGVDKNGKQIFDPDWPGDKIREARWNYFWRAVEPGTFSGIRRVGLGIASEMDKAQGGEGVIDPITRREYDPRTEWMAFLGMRPLPIDAKKQLGFSARAFADLRQRAGSTYRKDTRDIGGKENVPEAEETYRFMYDKAAADLGAAVAAARQFGLTEDEIEAALKGNGISAAIREAAMKPENSILPSLKELREQNLQEIEEKVQEEREARAGVQ